MADPNEVAFLKESGNQCFKEEDFEKALEFYAKGLKHELVTGEDKAVLHKNRAAVFLKLQKYRAVEKECTSALEIISNDAKAYYRRSQARENLEKFGEAFEDAKKARCLEPNNKVLTETLARLTQKIQNKQKEASSTENRVKQMFEYAFDPTKELSKRIQAMNNLLVLARERAGAEYMWKYGAVPMLLQVIQQTDPVPSMADEEEAKDFILATQRVLDELARNEERAIELMETIGHDKAVYLLNSSNQKFSDAASIFVQRIFNAVAGMNMNESKKPDPEACERNKVTIVRLVFELKRMLIDPQVTAIGRNNAIDLLLKNLMHMDGGLPRGWSWRFTDDEGLVRLLEVACNIPEQCRFPVSADTRDHVAICLTRLFEDCVFDKYRTIYQDTCKAFILEQLKDKTDVARIRICCCLTTLLMGPFDVGFSLIGAHGIMDIMLDMACSEDVLSQSVAAEAIVHTASKRERCSVIIAQGIPVLKKLYESQNDHIKARALVGMCKCAVSSGADASRKPMAEGSALSLAKTCKKFLLNESRNIDLRKWAAEGVAYLTIDADVKEWLVQDPLAVRALVELAKQAGQLCVFGVASAFVNLTNSYDKPKIDPEMVKLAKFAKHHVPEEHEKDKDEYVLKRIDLLVKEGATSACVALAQTESIQSKELLARALHSFTRNIHHRGTVVQEGGAKVLLVLTKSNSEAGQVYASHALAKLGITMDPSIAFPGQRMYECVRPLLSLLHPDRDYLQNYEALLALTNLASMSDSVRARIMKERCLPKLEEYWYEQEHEDLRDAASECILNLMHNKEVFEAIAKPGTDRLKLWVLYAGDGEDERLASAATSALALLTQDENVCKRILDEVQSWEDVLETMATRQDPTLQYRGMLAIHNMVHTQYDIAARIMQSRLFEILMAISKLYETDEIKKRAKAISLAEECLARAEHLELIKATDREIQERAGHKINQAAKAPPLNSIKTPLTIEELPEEE